MDFGYDVQPNSEQANAQENNGSSNSTNLNDGGIKPDGKDNSTDINDAGDSQKNDAPNSNKNDSDDGNKGDNGLDSKNNVDELVSGTTIEVDGNTYTVDEKGNVLDENGNIFKEANQVKDWLAGFEDVQDVSNEISIDSIKQALDIDITDDNDNSITYDNTVEGIKQYINDVINVNKESDYKVAIDSLYAKFPFVQSMINYYVANGNSLEGYGVKPDRSNIVVDDKNIAQQEAIIKTAWKEQNRKGDVDGYIEYLKSAGTLAATAREELQGLQDMDKERDAHYAKLAEEQQAKETKQIQDYWQSIYDIITSKRLGNYSIPDNIIVARGDKKFSATPEDFFNYLYRVDEKGNTAYQYDLANIDPEARKNDELLRAYLVFTGGNYSNLVDMAINENQVNKLRLVAKQQRNQSTVRINRPKPNGTKAADIDLGYN